jgi:hypothetical protein
LNTSLRTAFLDQAVKAAMVTAGGLSVFCGFRSSGERESEGDTENECEAKSFGDDEHGGSG